MKIGQVKYHVTYRDGFAYSVHNLKRVAEKQHAKIKRRYCLSDVGLLEVRRLK